MPQSPMLLDKNVSTNMHYNTTTTDQDEIMMKLIQEDLVARTESASSASSASSPNNNQLKYTVFGTDSIISTLMARQSKISWDIICRKKWTNYL